MSGHEYIRAMHGAFTRRWTGPQQVVLRHGDQLGARNSIAKLDERKVLAMRKRAARGESTASLARRYGVERGTVHGVVAGRSWRHVPMAGARP